MNITSQSTKKEQDFDFDFDLHFKVWLPKYELIVINISKCVSYVNFNLNIRGALNKI